MKLTITIDDQDALDAMTAIIEANGEKQSLEDFASEFLTLRFSEMREPQLLAAAIAKVDDDPELKAYRDRKEDEAKAAEAQVQAQANEEKI